MDYVLKLRSGATVHKIGKKEAATKNYIMPVYSGKAEFTSEFTADETVYIPETDEFVKGCEFKGGKKFYRVVETVE